MGDVREITVDKCVLLHCDSCADDAAAYRDCSNRFVDHFQAAGDLVVCLNAGIQQEYTALSSGRGKEWFAHMMGQHRYRWKRRAIRQPDRVDFVKKKSVPLHGKDFDYVDAASQSNTARWLSHETVWQNGTYRNRIRSAFDVTINTAAEYLAAEAGG